MIGGVNDRLEDADKLAELAGTAGALVNLLPLHPGGAPGFTPTSAAAIKKFALRLRALGVSATVRRSRGLDIAAACGQLRTETLRRDRGQVPADDNAGVEQEARV
jgi:23S rRNA (adenine2503-C2)-methyltransferase